MCCLSDAFSAGLYPNAEDDWLRLVPLRHRNPLRQFDCSQLIIRSSGFDLVQSDSDSSNGMERALTRYPTNGFYESLWQSKDVPAWFADGLAQFYTAGLKIGWYPPLLTAVRNDNLFAVDALAHAPSSDENVDLWQAQSYGMILYIADQIGVPGLFALARDVGKAASFAEAYQSALNKPLTSLLPDLKTWLFTDRAASAFEFTVYQPVTFTPTPSRTPTFTPTFTPSDQPLRSPSRRRLQVC